MAKVTRIAYSKNLTKRKFGKLAEIAARLGDLRTEIWRDYGSLAGLAYSGDRQLRDEWLAAPKGHPRQFNVPARLWKNTLSDVWADIIAYRQAAKVKVRQAIHKRTADEEERKRLYTLLKADKWDADPYLARLMRKYYKHGQTQVDYQIILDTGCYTIFEFSGKTWVDVMSLERGKRIAIPLNTNVQPSGTLRLILRNKRVEVHYAINAELVCQVEPCGDQTIGIDKGYTEAFTDSDGQHHGEGLGELLSANSDKLKAKYQRRHKFKALLDKYTKQGKEKKRQNILANNMGRKKLDAQRKKHTANVRNVVFNAAHTVVDKAANIAVEDLTSPIKDKKKYGKNQSRRLSGWVKGVMADAITTVSRRRGASVVLVNAAYTSQIDSRSGLLQGSRNGDRFYCLDGAVLDADQNAARNILARINDVEIKLFTPFAKVKEILVKRSKPRLGLLNQDISCSDVDFYSLSTMSELPFF